jgi:hypothetical protein
MGPMELKKLVMIVRNVLDVSACPLGLEEGPDALLRALLPVAILHHPPSVEGGLEG